MWKNFKFGSVGKSQGFAPGTNRAEPQRLLLVNDAQ